MISQAESVTHLLTAAAISTAMFAFGLRGTTAREPGGRARRSRRWPSLAGGVLGLLMTMAVAGSADLMLWRFNLAWWLLLVGLLGALLLGAALLRLGLRGRRVGDHPYCRQCGFDLFGKPASSTLCTECGSSLDAPAATVIGTHQRRMIPLSAGLFVLIIALALSVPIGREAITWGQRTDWTRFKTDAQLISELQETTNARRQSIALQALYGRIAADELSSDSMTRLIKAGRNLTQSGSRPTDPLLAPFVSYAAVRGWQQGKVDEAMVREVLRDSLDHRLIVASQAEAGGVVRYWVDSQSAMLGRFSWAPELHMVVANRSDRINGISIPPEAIDTAPLPLPNDARWTGVKDLHDRIRLNALPRPLPLGPATLETHLTATATLTHPGRPTLVETRDLVLRGDTTIVPSGTLRCPPITVMNDPTRPVDDPVNSAGEQELAEPEWPPDVYQTTDQSGRYCLGIRFVGRGAILGDVYLKHGSHERLVGTAFLSSYQSIELPLEKSLEKPEAGTEVIIRPAPERGNELFTQVATYHVPIVVKLP